MLNARLISEGRRHTVGSVQNHDFMSTRVLQGPEAESAARWRRTKALIGLNLAPHGPRWRGATKPAPGDTPRSTLEGAWSRKRTSRTPPKRGAKWYSHHSDAPHATEAFCALPQGYKFGAHSQERSHVQHLGPGKEADYHSNRGKA